MGWVSSATCFLHHDKLPHRWSETAEHAMASLPKPWDEISLSSIKLFCQMLVVTVKQLCYQSTFLSGRLNLHPTRNSHCSGASTFALRVLDSVRYNSHEHCFNALYFFLTRMKHFFRNCICFSYFLLSLVFQSGDW